VKNYGRAIIYIDTYSNMLIGMLLNLTDDKLSSFVIVLNSRPFKIFARSTLGLIYRLWTTQSWQNEHYKVDWSW